MTPKTQRLLQQENKMTSGGLRPRHKQWLPLRCTWGSSECGKGREVLTYVGMEECRRKLTLQAAARTR